MWLETILRVDGGPYFLGRGIRVPGESLWVLEEIHHPCRVAIVGRLVQFSFRPKQQRFESSIGDRLASDSRAIPSIETLLRMMSRSGGYCFVIVCAGSGIRPRGRKVGNVLEGPARWIVALADTAVLHSTEGCIVPEFARGAQIDLEMGEKRCLHDASEEWMDGLRVDPLDFTKRAVALG